MSISWGAMRKKLETENICGSLKGRITYFVTRYREAHDETGRAAVLVDGKEILQSDWFKWAKINHEQYFAGKTDENKNLTGAEYLKKIDDETHNLGGFDQYGFYMAFYEYSNQSIKDSLYSTDPLVRLLAIFDKRVGKRTLEVLKSMLAEQPEWLRYFYKLRLDSEGIE